jgi:PTS system cellobiose-specific IIC component
MNKSMNKLEDKLMPIANAISQNRYLVAIRDGFMTATPLLIIGAMFLLFSNFPIKGYSEFMTKVFGENWSIFFDRPFETTMAIMTIFVVLGISYNLAKHYELDGLSTAVIALVSFLVLTPFVTDFTPEGSKEIFKVGNVIPIEWMGSKGLFVGIITAILSTEIVRFVVKKGWVIRMPEGVPPSVSKSFSALIPAIITILLFDVVRLLFSITPFETIHNFIFKILQAPLTNLGGTLGATLLANLLIGLLWSFGIHGRSIVGAIMDPIWLALSAENLAAYQAGKSLPHIITGQFQEIYLQLGGTGSTLALCIALILVCKSKRCKQIGKLSIVPGLFNINEPVVFGLPIVLNPIMLIPYIATPLVLCVISYFAISVGFVPRPNGILVPWTTPPVIGGFLMAGVRGSLLQIVELVVSFFIYLPFVKAVDKQYVKEEQLDA